MHLVRSVRFAVPSATIEGIEYYEDRRLDKAQLLRFATCKYIADGRHIILKGASGNGKTYLACTLGNAACRKFKTVRYIRMPELLDELSVSKGCGDFKKTIKAYRKVDLLILDEWLIRCLTPQESYDLLEIIKARCSNGSMIFAHNTKVTVGTNELIPTQKMTVPFLRQLWIALFTMHMMY